MSRRWKTAGAPLRYFHVQEIENSRGSPLLFSWNHFFLISNFFDIGVFWNFGWKFKFLGRICFEMGPYGSDLAQNYTQLLQIGFPTRFDGSRGPKTSIFEFLKSCNFQKIAGGGPGLPP